MAAGDVKVNLLELFVCQRHGMIEPGRFDADWCTDYRCPVYGCDLWLKPLDLTPVLKFGGQAFVVEVHGRADGLYLFATEDLRREFVDALPKGSDFHESEETICSYEETRALARAEADGDGADA
jgi:hypothetical protein